MAERYRIRILPSALREIKAAPRPQQKLIRKRVNGLADDPRPDGYDLLAGSRKLRIHRVRVGEWRILYQVFDTELRVLVVRVADRKEVYNPTVMKQLRERIQAALVSDEPSRQAPLPASRDLKPSSSSKHATAAAATAWLARWDALGEEIARMAVDPRSSLEILLAERR